MVKGDKVRTAIFISFIYLADFLSPEKEDKRETETRIVAWFIFAFIIMDITEWIKFLVK